MEDINTKFLETEKAIKKAKEEINTLAQLIEKRKEELSQNLKLETVKTLGGYIDKEGLKHFLEEPYVILPKRKDEWYVISPKFLNFQVGWLEKTTTSYNIYVVNKFAAWLTDIPDAIKNLFKFKPKLPLKIFDKFVLTGEEYQEETWRRYKTHLSKRKGKDKIRIKKGHEFNLIAQMIDDGILPFIPTPVEKDDIRHPIVRFKLGDENRKYQLKAHEEFMKKGALGVFWPMGAGKSFLGMYLFAELKGPHLLVVPTKTLVEQWEKRLRKYTDCYNEVDIVTYAGYHKVANNKYTLSIFDECHRLPANTYSKFSTINSKYRLGLSATPYREDGRSDYIIALTGFPLGMDWSEFIGQNLIQEPDIKIYIVPNLTAKIKKLNDLLSEPKKTVVFCDSIKLGTKLSKKFEIPFIYGATTNRLEIFKQAHTVISSRVGDLGLSLKGIERVIEIDFLFGSRTQEMQRMGRVLHGIAKGEHIVLITEKEYWNYEKRFYGLY